MVSTLRHVKRAVLGIAIGTGLAMALLAAAEAAWRIAGRLTSGEWPATQMARTFDRSRSRARTIRRHPYLIAAPSGGARSTADGRTVAYNSLGYRSPERPLGRPPGRLRVLVSGGSTTFDMLAADNGVTWPARMEDQLRAASLDVEVWNAGFLGWTTAESLISFAIRDADLAPDVAVLTQGFNDLQPAAEQPFDPQYVNGHAALVIGALGLEPPEPRWYERSVLWERTYEWFGGDTGLLGDAPERGSTPRRPRIADAAFDVFARNLRSYVALTREHGAQPVLVTQTVRVRTDHRDFDRGILAWWIRGLQPDAVAGELERLNDVTRAVAAAEGVPLLDAAREIAWEDADFGDPIHHSAAGSAKMASFVARRLEPLLRDRARPAEPGTAAAR